MKRMLKGYMSLVALFSACAFVGTTSPERILVRSQAVDSARELVGWAHQVNLFDVGGVYGTFAVIPEYTQSFRTGRLAQSLFEGVVNTGGKNSDCASFNVTGSCVSGRGACDLLADYFGLPTDFSSTVTLKPKIQNFLVDFDLYLGLDEWLCGLWFRIHFPVVYAKWKLGFFETVNDAGVNAYPAGYFAPAAVPRANLLNSFGSYLSGQVPTLNGGVVFQPLLSDLVPCTNTSATGTSCNTSCGATCATSCDRCSLHRTKVAEVQFAGGWNFWQNEDYHVGLGLRVAAPCGTRINDNLLFSPVIGNGHHWQAGVMFTSHYTFWRGCDYDQSLGLYLDANIEHLFKTRQCRTFGICGAGPLSQYMLAEKLTTASTTNPLNGLAGATYTASTVQFANVLAPVANITSAPVKVSIPVQVDMTLMMNYQHCGFEWDLGYNLWATSCEKIKNCNKNCATSTTGNFIVPANWALKGDAFVYGSAILLPGTSPSGFTSIALAATESKATINAGTNGCPATAANLGNPRVDGAQLAYVGSGAGAISIYTTPTLPVGTAANPHESTSIQAVTLSDANLNVPGARNKGLTNKIFTNFQYTWDCECVMPYFGVGGKAEFASNKRASGYNNGASCNTSSTSGCNSSYNSSCNTGCNTSCVVPTSPSTLCNTGACGDFGGSNNCCRRSSISEWGIWLKGGVAWN